MLIEVDVKRPVAIPSDKSRVVDLRPGINQIDDSLLEHWFVKGLVESKIIVPVNRKKYKFKSLEQIAEEKKLAKQKEDEKPIAVPEKDPVVFATHSILSPVGTVLPDEVGDKKVVVVKQAKAKKEEVSFKRRAKKG